MSDLPALPPAPDLDEDRATRYYDRIRKRVDAYMRRQGSKTERYGDLLLLVPDMFALLWRLLRDDRVGARAKVLLGGGVAYYLLPFDFIPEALLGPIGFLDDLVVGAFILNRILTDIDPAIIREHWSGREDVLIAIQRILEKAESMVGSKRLERIKKIVK